MAGIKIGNQVISENGPLYFIADIASNHDGDINRAIRLIDLAKEAGANAAKFQNFKASTIVSKKGFGSIQKSTHQADWKKSVYEVYSEASLRDDWTEKLKKHCDEVGIDYMTSPYDYDAVDLAEPYVSAYKIGSGDITWTDMLAYIAQKNKPVLLATGASDMEDVERAVDVVSTYNKEIVLMQCNTNYTASETNYDYINLNVLKTYHKVFPDCILGLSDHTFGSATVVGAVALGARVFEKHFTDDNKREGPDHKFAMNPVTWKQMVLDANHAYRALGDGRKKIEENEQQSILVQQRAVYSTCRIEKGTVLSKEMLFPLRPVKANAVLPYEMESLIGETINCDVEEDTCITWGMVKND